MKKLICLSLVVALVASGCFLLFSCRNLGPPLGRVPRMGSPKLCYKGDLRFEAPTFLLGRNYVSGGLVYNSGMGLSVNIDALTVSTGQKFFGSGTIVNNPPHPFGSGQMIRLFGSVRNFDLRQGTRNVEFEYLDQGGTINLGARNGLNLYIGNMSKMHTSMVINGVTVTKVMSSTFSVR